MTKYIKKQSGLSIVATVIALLMLSLFIAVAVSLVTIGANIGVQEIQGKQAFYIAEGGMENTVLLLNTPNLTNRIACGSVTGNPNLTNEPLGTGQFTVTGASAYPAAPTTLNGAITNVATTITVFSTANYAAAGRIMLDRELIDYSGITPGTTTTFTVLRGRDGTTPIAHASGTPVGQYQCAIQSTGIVANPITQNVQRRVTEQVQLQEGWIVGLPGGVAAQRPLFVRFNRPTELQWNMYDSTAININTTLNSVSMLSYADGWAVGNASAGEVILRWNGSSWTRQGPYAGISNRNLNSIYCVGFNECYAVGAPGAVGQRPWIIQYNGVWSTYNTGNTANAALNSVYCPASGDCWAVGNVVGGYELVYRLSGGVWARQATNANIPNQTLMSVFCTSTTECFVAGTAGTLARWNGAAWTNVSLGALQLNSLYMLDTNGDNVADDGWAVGAVNAGAGPRPTVFRWNIPCGGGAGTGAWNNCTSAPYVPAINTALNSISCVDSGNCWAVGNASGGEVILHWDGTTWARVGPSAAIPDVNLRSVYLIGPKQRPQAAWREVYP